MTDKPQNGFIKKVITLYVDSTLGDRWKNTDDCNFTEIKCIEGYVVEEKTNE